ncbi:MAG TPA: MarR family transcriptional regulator [Xanthobacteraceae bacterium]|nr:MarR family transcriptional regulator [Xanthobacteraceae bacterium]
MGDEAQVKEDVRASAAQGATVAPLRLEEFLPYRINLLASLVAESLSLIYAKRYRIGIAEWRVLVTLGQYGVMTGKAIGAHSHMHKTKVSRAVRMLESRQLVMRRANRIDLREALLSLTPSGLDVYRDLAPAALGFAQRLVAVVDPSDRATLDRALTALTDSATRLAAEPPRGPPEG